MATLKPISVQTEDASKPKGFSPQTVYAQVGDAVSWHNDDQNTQHQPVSDSPPPNNWKLPPIPGLNPSSQINLNQADTIRYHDALDSSLTGVIVVATPVQIGQPFGGGDAAFSPPLVTIKAGTAVSWTNADGQPHQPAPVGGPANAWLAQPIAPWQKSPPVAKFSSAGTIQYEDALNKSIQGQIVVT